MKINERWEITADGHNFIVVEHSQRTNPKTGKPVENATRTFHPTLEQCADKIAKVEAMDAVKLDNVAHVVSELSALRGVLLELVNKRGVA